MYAEFEEKTYESHLLHELTYGSRFFSPGQVLEEIVGFDMAVYSTNPSLWSQFPDFVPLWRRLLRMPKRGIQLDADWWAELAGVVDSLPPFKFNCFIQAKRPEWLHRSTANEYSSWLKPYFRYGITPHQQVALEYLAAQTAGQAIVTYACPAFHQKNILWSRVAQKSVATYSNFAEATALTGHLLYSFADPGNEGVAHSEPTPVRSTPFFEQVERLDSREVPPITNVEFLSNAATVLAGAARSSSVSEVFEHIQGEIFPSEMHPLARYLAVSRAFETILDVRQLVRYDSAALLDRKEQLEGHELDEGTDTRKLLNSPRFQNGSVDLRINTKNEPSEVLKIIDQTVSPPRGNLE